MHPSLRIWWTKNLTLSIVITLKKEPEKSGKFLSKPFNNPELKPFPKTDPSFTLTPALSNLLSSRKKMMSFHNSDLDYKVEKDRVFSWLGADQKKDSLIYLLIFCTFLSVILLFCFYFYDSR